VGRKVSDFVLVSYVDAICTRDCGKGTDLWDETTTIKTPEGDYDTIEAENIDIDEKYTAISVNSKKTLRMSALVFGK